MTAERLFSPATHPPPGAADLIVYRDGVNSPSRPRTPPYHEILGVRATATAAEIRAAYRSRMREIHPDVSPEREEEAKLLNLAYEALQGSLGHPRPASAGTPPDRPIAYRLGFAVGALGYRALNRLSLLTGRKA